MTFASIETSSEGGAEFTDETVIGDAEITELESEANEVSKEVRGVNAAVNEDSAINVRVGEGAKCGRLQGRSTNRMKGGEQNSIPREIPAGHQYCR